MNRSSSGCAAIVVALTLAAGCGTPPEKPATRAAASQLPDSCRAEARPMTTGGGAGADSAAHGDTVPVLALDSLGGTVVQLRRASPWSVASGQELVLPVMNRSRRRAASCVRAAAMPLVATGSRRLARGHVTASLGAEAAGTPVAIPPLDQVPLRLSLDGFTDAGEYGGSVLLTSPDLSAPQRIPIAVQVTDAWYIPFLAILAGVLLAIGVRQINDRWRPAEVNRYHIVRLRAALVRWRAVVSDPARRADLAKFESALTAAGDSNVLGDVATASGILQQLETDMSRFGDAQRDLVQKAAATVGELSAALTRVTTRWSAMSPAERAARPTVDDRLARLRAALSTIEANVAREAVDDVERDQAPLRSELDQLEAELAPAPGGGPEGMEDVAAPAPPAAPVPTLSVVDPAERRRAGTEITFVLAPAGTVGPNDTLQWEFGDGAARTTAADTLRVSHAYAEPGRYDCALSIRDSAGRDREKLVLSLAVLPSREDEATGRIARSLRVADLAVGAVIVLVATLTGMSVLYVGKVFGTPEQYVGAILWGFGIDSTVRTLADATKRVGG